MKTRMVVGPPPLKYLKKYGKGGKFTKRYQNGGQLSNLANTISTVGGIASAIPGVGAIPGAIASVAAPILQAVSAQQAARSSFNKLYSSTPMMAKGGKLVKYAKGGSVEPPIIYNAPETTVTASRLPKGYSKMTKEQQARYDKFMKAKRPATGAAQTMDGFNDPIFNLITLPGNVKGVIQLSAALPGLVKAAPSVIKSATQIPKAARAALKKVDLSSLNPNRFKPTEGMMYRGIGKEGFEDAIQTGVFRAKQVDVPRGTGTIQLTKSFGQSPYFTPKFNTAKGYGAEYIAEVPKSAADWTQRYIRTDWSQYSKTPIPVNAGKILKKDWWKGYKEIDIPKKEKGGLIKRKDGSYSQRGLWDNIRANKGSGKKPTKQMLEQERKIKAKMEFGGKLKSDPPTKRGSLVYPSGYAPTVTGYPTASPAPNYSKAKSFNDAFSKARAAGESSFRYNNKIYSTKKDTDDIKLTPEVIKMYGDVNKILNKEYPELKKLLNRGTPVNKLQYIKDRASWLPSGINVGKTRLGKDEDPTSMLNIFNLPAELAHHEQFTNLPIGKRMLKFASGIKERFKYGDPGMYYKKGTIENEAHSQWEPAIELTARGNLTPEYIKQVQRKLGFTGKDVDGILGPKTYGKLVSAAGLSKKVLDNPEGRGDMEEGTDVLPKILKTMQNMVDMGSLQKTTSNETFIPEKAKGGLIKRKDGSYSKRGLWDNIRANKGSGKAPTKQMLEQERKIKNKMEFGGTLKGVDDLTFYKGRKHTNGGIMVSAKGTPSKQAVAEVEGGETRYLRKGGTYIFSDKLLV